MKRFFFYIPLIVVFLHPATGFTVDNSLYIEKYFQLLSNGSHDEKTIALRNLPRLINAQKYTEKPETWRPVSDLLKDNDPSIREAAAACLKEFGKVCKGRCEKGNIVPSLIEALTDKHSGVRREAIKALVFYKDMKLVDPLIDILRHDSDLWVRLEAAYALGQLNASRAVPALLDALRENSKDWRNKIFQQECIIALRNIGYRNAESIQLFIENANDAYLKAETIKTLGRFRAMAAKEILFQATNDPAPIIRELALRAIDRLPLIRTGDMDAGQHPKHEFFTRFLKEDASANVRAFAAEVLGRIGDKRAVKALIDALHDERAVQNQAILSLGRFEDENILAALIPFFGRSSESATSFLTIASNTANQTAYVYKKEGGYHAVKTLSEIPMALEENKPMYAPHSLGKLIQDYPTPAEKQLQDAPGVLKKTSKPVPYDKRIVHPDAVTALIDGLKDNDQETKLAVLKLINAFYDDRIEPSLIELIQNQPLEIRRAAISQLHHFITRKSLAPVLNLLDDSDGFMRARAAGLLGILKDKRAIDPLLNKLDDHVAEVRTAAVRSLKEFDDLKVSDETIRMLQTKSADLKKTALMNIKKKPDPGDFDFLIGLLDGPSNEEAAAQKAYSEAIERFGVHNVPKLDAQAIQEIDPRSAQTADRRAGKKLDMQKKKELEIRTWLSRFYNAALLEEQKLDVLAAQALGVMGDKRAVDPLIKALNGGYGQNQELMGTSARVLSSFEEKRITPYLIKKFGTMTIENMAEYDFAFLNSAKRALNRYEGGERAGILRQYLNDADKEIKRGAAFLLVMYLDESAVPDLEILLNDPDPEITEFTKKIIGGVKSGSYQKLKNIMERPQEVEGLIQLNAPLVYSPASRESARNPAAGQSVNIITKELATTGASVRKVQGIDKYVKLLQCGSGVEKKSALEIIPEIITVDEYRKNPAIIDPVLSALVDKDPFVRNAAARCLEKIGEKTSDVIDEGKIVPALAMALVDADKEVRMKAARALAVFPNEPAIDPLIERLYDENSRVRYEAAVSLGRLKAKKAASDLLDVLNDDTYWDQKSLVRNECLIAMRKAGSYPAQTIPLLIQHYNDETLRAEIVKALGPYYLSDTYEVRDLFIQASKDLNEEVRKSAFEAMGKASVRRAPFADKKISIEIDQFVKSLEDPSLRVREASVNALAAIGDERAVDPLINVLRDTDAGVQKAAVIAMEKFTDERILRELAPFLGRQSEGFSMVAWNSFLSICRKNAVQEVYVYRENGILHTVKSREQVPEKMSYSRCIVHPGTVDIIIDALNSDAADTRLAALKGIRNFSDDRIEGELIKHLDDPSSNVRQQTLRGLKDFATNRAVPDIACALSDPEPGVRKEAAWLLAIIEDKQAVPPLLKSLYDTDPDVQQSVFFALGQIKDRRAIEPLIEKLNDKDPMIRKAALRTLGNFDDPMVSSLNVKMLKDESNDVRKTAINNIQINPDKNAVEPLIFLLEDPGLNSQAATALGMIGDTKAIDPLIMALNSACFRGAESDADTIFTLSAITALARLGGKKTVEALLRVAEGDIKNTRVKIMAIERLGGIGDKMVTKPLITILMDERSDIWVRAAAASALGEMGGEDVVDPLMKSTNELSAPVRHAAEEALKKIGKF